MATFLRQSMLGPSLTPGMPLHDEELNNPYVQEETQENGEEAGIDKSESEDHRRAAEMDENLSNDSVKSLTLTVSVHEEPKEDAARIHDLLDQRLHKPPVVAEGKRRPSMDKDLRNVEGIAIAAILCARTNAQRQEIARVYMDVYGNDLVDTMQHLFTGEFGELIQALMETPARYDAKQLHRAITSTNILTGLSTKDSTLIEILCTRNNQELRNIKQEYRRLFKNYLEHDLSKVTWSHLMHLFMWLSVGSRDESTHVDEKMANEDARALWRGEEGVGFDATLYNVLFSLQSEAQLRAVFAEYKLFSEIDIVFAVDNEFPGDYKDALTALIMRVNNELPIFYAHRLHSAMHSMTSHDTSLTRMLVTRSEIDLKQIKQMYEHLYHKSLETEITAYCSSAFREGLLALVRSH